MKIGIINGPNMNLLGEREPEYYGMMSLNEIEAKLNEFAEKYNCKLLFFQSNHEGDIVDFIHHHIDEMNGIVINPAGYSKTGYAILDAMEAKHIPYIEVHMSNIFNRGSMHSETIFLKNAVGNIVGLKGNVYLLGLQGIINYLNKIMKSDVCSL